MLSFLIMSSLSRFMMAMIRFEFIINPNPELVVRIKKTGIILLGDKVLRLGM